jgi:hypothetical protein
MPSIWSRPLRISAHLQFLFDNAPPPDPAQAINITCNGPHVENVSSGIRNPSEYGQRYVFVSHSFVYLWVGAYFVGQCIRKQCNIWKHWLRGPLTKLEQATLREKEEEWRANRGMKPPAKRQGACIKIIACQLLLTLFL